MASSKTRQKVRLRDVGVKTCVSQKVSYADYDEALQAAEVMMLEGRVDPGCHITPYRCRDCSDWHVWNRPIVVVNRRGYGRS